jgi:hypothetical protein
LHNLEKEPPTSFEKGEKCPAQLVAQPVNQKLFESIVIRYWLLKLWVGDKWLIKPWVGETASS